MLKPETARIILNAISNLVLLLTGVTVIGVLWSILTGGMQRGTLSTSVPASMTLMVENQSFQITRMNLVAPHPEPWMWAAWLTFIALLLAAVVFGYRRMKRFVNRLLDDPFAAENAIDLRLASRVALMFQGVSLLITLQGWWTVHRLQPVATLVTALNGLSDVRVVEQVFNSSIGALKFLGVDLTPLLIAALLAILATVFQRGHDLREAERTLRAEQELTV